MSKTVRNAEYCCVLSGGSVTKDGSCVAPAAVASDEQTGPHDPGAPINEGMMPKPPTAFELPLDAYRLPATRFFGVSLCSPESRKVAP